MQKQITMKSYIYTYITLALIVFLFFLVGCSSKRKLTTESEEKTEIKSTKEKEKTETQKDSAFSLLSSASESVEYIEITKSIDTIKNEQKTAYLRRIFTRDKNIDILANYQKTNEDISVKMDTTITTRQTTEMKEKDFSFWDSFGKVSFVLMIICFVMVLIFQYLKNK